MDYFLNGQGFGSVAEKLLAVNGDVGVLRPYIGSDGETYITRTINGKPHAVRMPYTGPRDPVTNTPIFQGTLTKEAWIKLDEVILKIAKERLDAVADLRSAGLEYNMPNGIAHTVLQHERVSDITPAQISMDGITQTQTDRPLFDLVNLPLPLIHKDFKFNARQLMASRMGNAPLDTTTAELAVRRCVEEAEKLLIGITDSYSFGGGTVYGYTNFPDRITDSDLTDPSGGGWTPNQTLSDILAYRGLLADNKQHGQFMLYHGLDWDEYMDGDYFGPTTSNPRVGVTLRERLKMIRGVVDVRCLDLLTGFDIILVKFTSENVRMVVGMDIVTIQWETHGGMELNYKVMCMMVPQLRSDMNGNCGILHATI